MHIQGRYQLAQRRLDVKVAHLIRLCQRPCSRKRRTAQVQCTTDCQLEAHLSNALGKALCSGVPHDVVWVVVVVEQLQHASRIEGQEGDALHLQAMQLLSDAAPALCSHAAGISQS